VFADAFGEEKLLRDHAFSQFLCALRGGESCVSFLSYPHESIASWWARTEFPANFSRFVIENQIRNAPGRFAPKNCAWRPHVSFETRQNEDVIVVRRFLAEFLIDADW
jgi:hypothetical protein